MIFTIQMHGKISLELAEIHRQLISAALILEKSLPRQDRICKRAKRLAYGRNNTLNVLRHAMESMAGRELPAGERHRRIYFPVVSPEPNPEFPYKDPEQFAGVPAKLAKKFAKIREAKKNNTTSRRKPRLTWIEIQVFSRFFKHVGDHLAVIGIGLTDHYGAGCEPAKIIDMGLATNRELILELSRLQPEPYEGEGAA